MAEPVPACCRSPARFSALVDGNAPGHWPWRPQTTIRRGDGFSALHLMVPLKSGLPTMTRAGLCFGRSRRRSAWGLGSHLSAFRAWQAMLPRNRFSSPRTVCTQAGQQLVQ